METQPYIVGRKIEINYNKYNSVTQKNDIPYKEYGELLAVIPHDGWFNAIYKEKETLKLCTIIIDYVKVLD